MADIDYRQIASHIVKDSKKLKTATRNTLNDVAFIAQRDMTEQASSDMTFRKSAKRALGFRVNKASYGKMEASIVTNRGWLHYHLEEGTRNASSGITFKGTNYLIVPVSKQAFTKTKKLKKSYAKRAYIVPDGSGALMFYRPRRGQSVLIASLKRSVDYNEDTDPADAVTEALKRDGLRILQHELNYKR